MKQIRVKKQLTESQGCDIISMTYVNIPHFHTDISMELWLDSSKLPRLENTIRLLFASKSWCGILFFFCFVLMHKIQRFNLSRNNDFAFYFEYNLKHNKNYMYRRELCIVDWPHHTISLAFTQYRKVGSLTVPNVKMTRNTSVLYVRSRLREFFFVQLCVSRDSS